MRLFRSLILPQLDYGALVLAMKKQEYEKEFGKVQRSTMLKAKGCLYSISTEALDILTNSMPMGLHLKLRQAQELVKIARKSEKDPHKNQFASWTLTNLTSPICSNS